MLRQAVGAAAGVAGRVVKKKEPEDASIQDMARAVIANDPAFNRLDGILTGLAEACMNPVLIDTVQVIGLCSAAKSEGKTTVAIGLATALANRMGNDVLLLETDLRNPTLAEDLGYNPTPGLTDCLLGEAPVESAVQPTALPHLFIMTAGVFNQDPLFILGKEDLRQLLRVLRSRYRYIVLDMPAILEREEAGRLVELADRVILVVSAGKTAREVTEQGAAAIGRDKLMGVVLNRAQPAAPRWLTRILSADGNTL